MKEERVNQNTRYSYFYSRKTISQDKLIDDGDYSLDSVQGISGQNRVPGAPTWVSAISISPIALSPDAEIAAIGIEGGVIMIRTSPRQDVEMKVVPIAGAARTEAIMIDSSNEIYCAHSQPNNQGLLVSRVSPSDLKTKTLSLLGPVGNMITDTRPLKAPALKYKSHRAVSLVKSALRSICISHGRRIYSILTDEMTVQSSVTVDLPCRLIRAKIDRPPHEKHEGYGGAEPCCIVWAIGASYVGDGTTAGGFKTQIYKLGFD